MKGVRCSVSLSIGGWEICGWNFLNLHRGFGAITTKSHSPLFYDQIFTGMYFEQAGRSQEPLLHLRNTQGE
jgi:hypothetical protein